MRTTWIWGLIFQQLRYYWRQTLLAISGVAIGVTVLLVILSVTHGLEQFYREQMLQLTPHVTLEAGINQLVTADLQQEIESVEGVLASAPFLRFPALITRSLASESVVIKGVDWGLENNLHGIEELLEAGSWDVIHAQPGVLIGGELARLLGVELGELIQITSSQSALHLPVNGIFFTGFYTNDAKLVMMPIGLAQRLWNVEGYTGYGVNVVDLIRVTQYISPLQRKTNLWVRPWYQQQPALFIGLQVQRQVVIVLVLFVFVVAAFGIANVFLLRLLSQAKTIGVLRALGATPQNIWQLFIGQALLCGVIGSMIGLGTAYSIQLYLAQYPIRVPEVYYFQRLPVRWASSDIWWVIIVALLTCVIAIFYPALRFSQVQPTEVMKNE